MEALAFVAGVVVVALTAANVVFTMVLPRRPFGLDRLTVVIARMVRQVFMGLTRLARSYEGKDAILAPAGPVTLVVQLLTWAAGLTLGFGLLVASQHHGFGDAVLQAVAALFTVGTMHAGGPPVFPVDVAAGAMWAVVVALQIAYLPTIYAAFSRREAQVALLESRAGLPAWGPEVLIRQQLVGILDTLPELYGSWETWAAEVAESHTTYPVLLFFRSPEPWYSWVLGALAVMDAAAIHLAAAPTTAGSRARLCLRMGFTLLDRIGLSLGWEIDADPDPDGPIELTYEEYAEALAMLADAGFPLERTAEESWPDFVGWRVNYEPAAYRLADQLLAPPAPWSGPRRHLEGGPVWPRRPPQRHPDETPTLRRQHALVGAPGRRARRRSGR
jgi:hypothetical protein